ncbi:MULTISPECIES: hypothetical protein [unclassified Leptospira]|uniref:hypothetical protein n=1 Tax=unclassified Leptospira TaxID=2633828 RepID=UPI0005189202|nr:MULTISPECIES: hypothetical protein [unclassified Leptospira]
MFQKTVQVLRNTDILVIIGYSFPDEDALLRFLLRQFAEGYSDFERKKILYIDKIDRSKMKSKLITVFPQLALKFSENVEVFAEGFIDWIDS